MKNEIILKNICIEYDNIKILSNISFNVKPGIPTCIIGKGASGKTTLLKAIVGLIKVKNGDIFLNKYPKAKKESNLIDNPFGVVFQKDALFDSLNVWQNIMFKSIGEVDNKSLILKAKKILKAVGLSPGDAFLHPNELSGGMKKRVAIGRAISHDPGFLILDEPTAGLDPVKSNLIFNIIKNLAEKKGISILAVTSDMKGALRYFKKIIVLDNKKLHWKGTNISARKKPTPLLKKLFQKI